VRSEDALLRLRELLNAAGVVLEHPTAADVDTTWSVMRRFASEPVKDCEPRERDGDGMLAQYGAWSGPFELDITRQFTFVDADGEYDHMAQLNCTFKFALTDRLAAVGSASEWSFGIRLTDFFADVLELPGFRAVRETKVVPLELELHYGDV